MFRLKALEADFDDLLARDLLAFRARHAAQLQSEGHVAQHVGPGKQRKVLKYEGPLRSRTVDLLALDPYLAGVVRDQTGDNLEQRRLAATARAEQAAEFGARKRETDVLQRLDATLVGLTDSFDLDNCRVLHRHAPRISDEKSLRSKRSSACIVSAAITMIEAIAANIFG